MPVKYRNIAFAAKKGEGQPIQTRRFTVDKRKRTRMGGRGKWKEKVMMKRGDENV